MTKDSTLLKDYNDLKSKLREMGLFEYSRFKLITDITLIICCFVVSILLTQGVSMPLAFIFASIGGIGLVWWIHDVGHDACFQSRTISKIAIESLGILFLGMPQIEYHNEVHRLHHAHTNIIGKDGALSTGPVRWHFKQLTSDSDHFSRFQAAIWFCVALPLVWPLISSRCIQTLWQRKQLGRFIFLILRWALVLWVFRTHLAFVFIPPLIAGFVMGFVSSLNHFHMPMDDKKTAKAPHSVFLTTQNLSNRSFFATWITGGLNFHIEHHLFPTMPSGNLQYAAPLVEDFARKHGLPYQICSASMATRKLYGRLQNPVARQRAGA